MKLSMWIIKEWLSEYEPVATISSGKQSIEGVRFFTESTIQQERYIYISRTEDVFTSSRSHEVLLIHGNDTISLKSNDLEDVLNKTLAAFEYFNDWEQQLREAAAQDKPEQSIIDVCEALFGPTFLMDINFNLLGFSQNYGAGEVNSIWDEFLLEKGSSLKTMNFMKTSSYTKLFSKIQDMQIYEEPEAHPYKYGLMTSYLSDDGELIGQLAFASDKPITQREYQLAQSVKDVLSQIRHKPETSGAGNFAENMFRQILSRKDIDALDLRKFMVLLSWSDSDSFFIIQASSIASEDELLASYKEKITNLIPDSVFTLFDGRLIGIIMSNDKDRIAAALLPLAKDAQLHVGISNSCHEIEDVAYFAEQALEALRDSRDTNKVVTHFHECALHSITHSIDRSFIARSVHPDALVLKEYDRKYNNEYAKTLRVFLQNERSHTATAELLFVHRNTILYRINKILDLTSFDLNNPYEREYLLTSFRMLD